LRRRPRRGNSFADAPFPPRIGRPPFGLGFPATRPRDTRWLIGIVSICVVGALALLDFMFFGDEHYVAPPAPGIEKPGITNQR